VYEPPAVAVSERVRIREGSATRLVVAIPG
jgi:hypothetical protein